MHSQAYKAVKTSTIQWHVSQKPITHSENLSCVSPTRIPMMPFRHGGMVIRPLWLNHGSF
nr:MAG TPA: hypothetical protein [Crassvirales sp.]